MRNNFTRDPTSASGCGQAGQNENDGRSDSRMRVGDISCVKAMRLLRLPQVMQQTGLRKTTLYELQKEGSFPMRIQVTSNSVGWIEEEINAWIAGRVAASKPLRIK